MNQSIYSIYGVLKRVGGGNRGGEEGREKKGKAKGKKLLMHL